MIKIGKILVPTDFSNVSFAGIRYALSLAKDHGAEVFVCHVVSREIMRNRGWDDYQYIGSGWVPSPQPVAIDELIGDITTDLARVLNDMLEPEQRKGVRIVPLVRIGKVVDEIVSAAKETQCDLIVMASRERSWLGRLVATSLTQQVVRLAPCPVLSIQPWAQVKTGGGERVSIRQLQLAA